MTSQFLTSLLKAQIGISGARRNALPSPSDYARGMKGRFNRVRRHPIFTFFFLSFFITWGCSRLPLIAEASGLIVLPGWTGSLAELAFAGPTFAGLFVATTTGGRRGFLGLLRRSLNWRVGGRWYAITVGLPAFLGLVALGILSSIDGEVPNYGWSSQDLYLIPVIFFSILLTDGPIYEELGWRAYGQPALQEKYSDRRHPALLAAVIIGTAWGLWHIPEFFYPRASQYLLIQSVSFVAALPIFASFVLTEIGNSIVMAWICNKTKGSALLGGFLYHASINTVASSLIVQLSLKPAETIVTFGALMLASALILVLATHGGLGQSSALLEKPVPNL